MSKQLQAIAISDVGKTRTANEDNFLLVENLWGNADMTLLGAIDGVGGYKGGAEAAKLAKDTIEGYLNHFKFGAPLQLLLEAIVAANNKIHTKRSEDESLQRMSCVLTVGIIDSDKKKLYVGHVGDSRGYILSSEGLQKITKDHSDVGMKEDNGFLTEEEAMHHPRRNEISRMLGEIALDNENNDQYIELSEHDLLGGDIVMFCSDGLTDLVTRDEIKDILIRDSLIAVKAKDLIDRANEKGGKDNITVAMGILKGGVKSNKSRPKGTVIEIPVSETILEKPAEKKAKFSWIWILILLAVFALGYIANWNGSRQFFTKPKPIVDSTLIKDTLAQKDSLKFDTLINATDTINNSIIKDSIAH